MATTSTCGWSVLRGGLLAVIMFSATKYVQDSLRIALVDRQSGEPIAGAVCRCGQSGAPSFAELDVRPGTVSADRSVCRPAS